MSNPGSVEEGMIMEDQDMNYLGPSPSLGSALPYQEQSVSEGQLNSGVNGEESYSYDYSDANQASYYATQSDPNSVQYSSQYMQAWSNYYQQCGYSNVAGNETQQLESQQTSDSKTRSKVRELLNKALAKKQASKDEDQEKKDSPQHSKEYERNRERECREDELVAKSKNDLQVDEDASPPSRADFERLESESPDKTPSRSLSKERRTKPRSRSRSDSKAKTRRQRDRSLSPRDRSRYRRSRSRSPYSGPVFKDFRRGRRGYGRFPRGGGFRGRGFGSQGRGQGHQGYSREHRRHDYSRSKSRSPMRNYSTSPLHPERLSDGKNEDKSVPSELGPADIKQNEKKATQTFLAMLEEKQNKAKMVPIESSSKRRGLENKEDQENKSHGFVNTFNTLGGKDKSGKNKSADQTVNDTLSDDLEQDGWQVIDDAANDGIEQVNEEKSKKDRSRNESKESGKKKLKNDDDSSSDGKSKSKKKKRKDKKRKSRKKSSKKKKRASSGSSESESDENEEVKDKKKSKKKRKHRKKNKKSDDETSSSDEEKDGKNKKKRKKSLSVSVKDDKLGDLIDSEVIEKVEQVKKEEENEDVLAASIVEEDKLKKEIKKKKKKKKHSSSESDSEEEKSKKRKRKSKKKRSKKRKRASSSSDSESDSSDSDDSSSSDRKKKKRKKRRSKKSKKDKKHKKEKKEEKEKVMSDHKKVKVKNETPEKEDFVVVYSLGDPPLELRWPTKLIRFTSTQPILQFSINPKVPYVADDLKPIALNQPDLTHKGSGSESSPNKRKRLLSHGHHEGSGQLLSEYEKFMDEVSPQAVALERQLREKLIKHMHEGEDDKQHVEEELTPSQIRAMEKKKKQHHRLSDDSLGNEDRKRDFNSANVSAYYSVKRYCRPSLSPPPSKTNKSEKETQQHAMNSEQYIKSEDIAMTIGERSERSSSKHSSSNDYEDKKRIDARELLERVKQKRFKKEYDDEKAGKSTVELKDFIGKMKGKSSKLSNGKSGSSITTANADSTQLSSEPYQLDMNYDYNWYYQYYLSQYPCDPYSASAAASAAYYAHYSMITSVDYTQADMTNWMQQQGYAVQSYPQLYDYTLTQPQAPPPPPVLPTNSDNPNQANEQVMAVDAEIASSECKLNDASVNLISSNEKNDLNEPREVVMTENEMNGATGVLNLNDGLNRKSSTDVDTTNISETTPQNIQVISSQLSKQLMEKQFELLLAEEKLDNTNPPSVTKSPCSESTSSPPPPPPPLPRPNMTTLTCMNDIQLPNGQVLPAGTKQMIVHPYSAESPYRFTSDMFNDAYQSINSSTQEAK